MRMELRRMNGAVLPEREWPVHGRPIGEVVAEARDALASCYEGDRFSLPKKEFYPNTPEEVCVLGLTVRLSCAMISSLFSGTPIAR